MSVKIVHALCCGIAVIALSIPLAAQDSIREWRKATKAEISTEINREYKAMSDVGMIGDPACTVGIASWDGVTSYEDEPCALTNGKGDFMGLVEIHSGKVRCSLTDDQAVRFKTEESLFAACNKGKLPKLILFDLPSRR